MIKEDLQNRMDTLFPGVFNKVEKAENLNVLGNGGDNLWKTVSEKYISKVGKILAPISELTVDVYPDLEVRNQGASPTVQVEVIDSVGNALYNTTNWDQSDISNSYVDVKLDRISRPFYLTSYDLMHGERIESKVGAAMEAVANGVFAKFIDKITSHAATLSQVADFGKFGPEEAVKISGAFGQSRETETLLLSPSLYSKIVPTNGLGLDPAVEGTYGINHIYKTAMENTGGSTVAAVALAKDAVVGAVGVQQSIIEQPGQFVQDLGTIAGVPMTLIGHWSYEKQAMQMSVETFAGFAVTSTDLVKYAC